LRTDGSHAPMAFDSARALRAPALLNIVSSRPSCLLLHSCECEQLRMDAKCHCDLRVTFLFFSRNHTLHSWCDFAGNKQTTSTVNPHNHQGGVGTASSARALKVRRRACASQLRHDPKPALCKQQDQAHPQPMSSFLVIFCLLARVDIRKTSSRFIHSLAITDTTTTTPNRVSFGHGEQASTRGSVTSLSWGAWRARGSHPTRSMDPFGASPSASSFHWLRVHAVHSQNPLSTRTSS
jgi:hypothetical protein